MASADTSTLVIKELTGEKRVVTLRGPSLPFQGAKWGGEQRVTTTWYPGNAAEATQQVLGPIEKESTWDGRWSTTMMLRTPAYFENPGGSSKTDVVRASSIATVLEDICRKGQRLRVEWQNTLPRSTVLNTPSGPSESFSILPEQTFKVVREGRAVEWDFSFVNADDVDWSITFQWASRGAVQQKILTTRSETTQSKIQELVLELEQAAKAAETAAGGVDREKIETLPETLSLGDLENFADGPKDLMASFAQSANLLANKVKKIGELIQTVKSLPASLANQALDVANNAIAVTTNFIDTMNRRPVEVSSLKIKVSQLTKATQFFSNPMTQSAKLETAALELRKLVSSSSVSSQTMLAVHIVRGVVEIPVLALTGEVVTNLSIQYYATPDHAASILRANNLPLSQLFVVRGTVLIIPTLDAIRQFSPTGN